MIPFKLPLHPQHRAHRQDEHGLKLEPERQRHTGHGEHRPLVQRKVYAEQREGDIYAVALRPDGAVEKHGRPQQPSRSPADFCQRETSRIAE